LRFCVLLMLLCSWSAAMPARADVATSSSIPGFSPAAPHHQAQAPHLGHYSPNTTIEQRDGELWFVRPPYESQLVPNGAETYQFAQGWLAGKLMHFAPNESGGVSIMLLADDGTWNEFARSGEVYTDLDPVLRGTLTHILDKTIAENPSVPGAVLYVSIPGQGVWMGARGVANRALNMPMVPHDRFRVASVSKVFVATIILQLAEEGVLSLDDTVEQWMPGLVPDGERITLRHLLNHTSGLYNYLEGAFVDAFMADHGRLWTQQQLVSYAVSHPPYFAPGEPGRWHYSNTNYVLLGMVVEHATGTSVGQQVRWRILDPLGLHNTSFEPYETAPPGIVHGYVGRNDMSNVNMSIVWAAGGVVSTAEDLGRFAEALFGGQLLQPASLAEMHGFVSVDGSWGAQHLVYGLGLMQDVMSIGPDHTGQPRPYELGLVRGHTGALIGYRSAMWYLPESGITIAVGVNQMYYDANKIVTPVMDAILAYNEQIAQP
jgi:D-alanyl-D-alanine carboxypeptidase